MMPPKSKIKYGQGILRCTCGCQMVVRNGTDGQQQYTCRGFYKPKDNEERLQWLMATQPNITEEEKNRIMNLKHFYLSKDHFQLELQGYRRPAANAVPFPITSSMLAKLLIHKDPPIKKLKVSSDCAAQSGGILLYR